MYKFGNNVSITYSVGEAHTDGVKDNVIYEVQTHTHTHNVHTQTHTQCTYTNTHTHSIHTHARTHTHTHTAANACTQTQTHTHTDMINCFQTTCFKNGKRFANADGWHMKCIYNSRKNTIEIKIICATLTDSGYYQVILGLLHYTYSHHTL